MFSSGVAGHGKKPVYSVLTVRTRQTAGTKDPCAKICQHGPVEVLFYCESCKQVEQAA